MNQEVDNSVIDPIWTSSRTARQIHALGEVDKVYSYDRLGNCPEQVFLGYNPSVGLGRILNLFANVTSDGQP